jgi:hypothetical protein
MSFKVVKRKSQKIYQQMVVIGPKFENMASKICCQHINQRTGVASNCSKVKEHWTESSDEHDQHLQSTDDYLNDS